MTITTRRAYSLISISCFLLIAVALIIIHNSTATGYELSFYSSVSPLVWVFLILSIIGGLTILVKETFANDKQSHWWLAGLAVLILAYIVISIIPPLRGYVIYGRGDILTHAGWVKDILSTGNFSPDNYYPVVHIFITQVTEICNVDYISVMNYLPCLFAFVNVFSIYLLSKTVLSNRGQILMATACGTLLVAWGNITLATRYGCFPTSLSTLIVPLVLFVYFKAKERRSFPYIVMLILLLILMPFFHPLCAAMLALFLIIIEISPSLLRRVIVGKRISQYSLNTMRQRINLAPSFILFAVLFIWISGFLFFTNRLNNFYEWLLGQSDVSKGKFIWGKFLGIEQGFGESLVVVFFKLYGDIFIYCILTAIAIIMLIRMYRTSQDKSTERLLTLALCFIVSSLLLLFMLPLNIVSPMRMLGFMSIFSTVLSGFTLYELGKRKSFYKAIVIPVLAVVAIIGIFHSYNSPYTMQYNNQITHMEIQGYEWALSHSDGETTFITAFGTSPIKRFSDAILGETESYESGDINRLGFLPDNFNYSKYQTLGESFGSDMYFVITKADIMTYTGIWAEFTKFTTDDLAELELDPTVAILYTNGEMEVYRVSGTMEWESM